MEREGASAGLPRASNTGRTPAIAGSRAGPALGSTAGLPDEVAMERAGAHALKDVSMSRHGRAGHQRVEARSLREQASADNRSGGYRVPRSARHPSPIPDQKIAGIVKRRVSPRLSS